MVTQQFHETLEPLSEWLTATEKHLVHSEPIGTETSKLEEQISLHKVAAISLFGSIHFTIALECIAASLHLNAIIVIIIM